MCTYETDVENGWEDTVDSWGAVVYHEEFDSPCYTCLCRFSIYSKCTCYFKTRYSFLFENEKKTKHLAVLGLSCSPLDLVEACRTFSCSMHTLN